MNIWVDTFLATPLIGIKIKPNLKITSYYPQLTSNYFENLSENEEELNISDNSIASGYNVSSSSGNFYTFKYDSINIGYKYSMKENRLPGRFTNYDFPDVKYYSQLLDNIKEETKKIFQSFVGDNQVTATRIGIVATIKLDINQCPPGIESLIEYLKKPWTNNLKNFNVNFNVDLLEDENHNDKFHCLMKLNEFDKEELDLTLDWQRYYKNGVLLNRQNVENQLNICTNKAVNYFEEFGIGNLNYEE